MFILSKETYLYILSFLFIENNEAVENADTTTPPTPGTAEESKDVEMEEVDDHCRAEGVIKFEVNNVSKIKETVLSEAVMIRNLPW